MATAGQPDTPRKARVLMTGASGGMGMASLRQMVPELGDAYDLVALVRDSEKNRGEMAPFEGTRGLEVVWGDLDDDAALRRCLEGTDLVLHIAAFVSPAADYHPKTVMYSEGCRLAYQELSRLPEFSLDTDRQARLVRPLAFGLLDPQQTAYARKRLVKACESYGWRLGTGFLSTPLILDVLAKYDLDAAYRLLENEEMPGWLFMPKMGATTVWESWEGTQAQGGIASLNHYSKGAVCAWLFRVMCGITPDGERHVTVAPRPGGRFAYAKAGYESPCGFVGCGWQRVEDGWRFAVEVPANCAATVVLPDGSTREVGAGVHEFECVARAAREG